MVDLKHLKSDHLLFQLLGRSLFVSAEMLFQLLSLHYTHLPRQWTRSRTQPPFVRTSSADILKGFKGCWIFCLRLKETWTPRVTSVTSQSTQIVGQSQWSLTTSLSEGGSALVRFFFGESLQGIFLCILCIFFCPIWGPYFPFSSSWCIYFVVLWMNYRWDVWMNGKNNHDW